MNFAAVASSTKLAIEGLVGDFFTLFTDNIETVLLVLSVTVGIPLIIRLVKRLAK